MAESHPVAGGRSRTSVVLPMLTLVPGGMGGSETYARALALELSHFPDLDVSVLVSRNSSGNFPEVRELTAFNLLGNGSTLARLSTVARAANPWFGHRHLLKSGDVVHYPLTVPVPRRPKAIPMVQTVHDVQHHDLAELFSSAERAYRSVAYDLPARHADRVVTVSHFCKERLIACLGLKPERIHVAHLGVDTKRFTPSSGARRPFVLYPARAWPHKNHARLVDAVAILRTQMPDVRLVLTGSGAEGLGPLPEWVEHHGLVAESALRDLYAAASCLAFPSLYEGFGLPPLEAMASGCPVAAANVGALPEVCGDAAVLFDPTDVPAMARALAHAIHSRDRLVPLGLRRARQLTWRACATIHADIYRELASA